MSVEEMLLYLGVRTQSEESIRLCYLMDMEAFSMMEDVSAYNFYDEKRIYEVVYNLLLDYLDYQKLDSALKEEYEEIVAYLDLDEEDKEYREKYFTGLERTLLRFNYFDLISIQPYKDDNTEGLAQNAYVYELKKLFIEALKLYVKLGFQDRIEIVKRKMEMN